MHAPGASQPAPIAHNVLCRLCRHVLSAPYSIQAIIPPSIVIIVMREAN